MPNDLSGKRIAIFATDGFEQVELLQPKEALEDMGAQTEVISLRSGIIKGWDTDKWGQDISVDVTVEAADPAGCDALLLPGGVINPDKLRTEPKAVEFAKAFFSEKNPVAAICHGPWLLVEAGVLRGRTVTSWPSLKTDITNAGEKWVDQEVSVDGILVTSRKPADIPGFNKEFIKILSQKSSSSKGAGK